MSSYFVFFYVVYAMIPSYMKHLLISFVFVLIFISPALAQDSRGGDKGQGAYKYTRSNAQSDVHQGILTAVLTYSKAKDPVGAKLHLTPRSHTLYERMYAHNLFFLLPNNTQAVFERRDNSFDYVRFMDIGAGTAKKNQYVTMAFFDDVGVQKLDLPETFRLGFGDDWLSTVNMLNNHTYLRANITAKKKQLECLRG